MWVWSLGRKDPLEDGTVNHSSILTWRIPWADETTRLQSVWSQRVGHNWSNFAHTHAYIYKHEYRNIYYMCGIYFTYLYFIYLYNFVYLSYVFLLYTHILRASSLRMQYFVELSPLAVLPRCLRWSRCPQHRRPGFNPWVGKIPWRRKWQPTPVFLPGESHGQRSLAGYSLCCAYSLSCVQLFLTSWAVAHQAPLSMGILQSKILEWLAMPSSRKSSQFRDRTQVSRIADGIFTV